MEATAETLRMYFKLLGIALKSMLQFRMDFFIGVLGIVARNVASLLAIGVILSRFTDLAGWTVWQVVFLYGFWMTGNSLYSLLFFHLSFIDDYIVEGVFDRFLMRPLSPFLQLLTVEVDLNGIADVVFGVSALGLAMSNLHMALNLGQWAFMLVMLACAALLELGITVALSSVAFWTNRAAALIYTANQLNWGMTQQYPLEMFGKAFRVFVTVFLPFAFINYYPARWLLGKVQPGDPGYVLSFLSPVAALVTLVIAAVVWRKGLKAYNSTGS